MVECENHTIVEMIRSMLHAHNLNKSFWAEVVANAIYTHNHCPMRVLPLMAPEEAWSKGRPYIAYISVFTCTTCAMVPDEKML